MFPIYLKNYRNYIHNICDILHLWVWFKSLSNYLFIPVFSSQLDKNPEKERPRSENRPSNNNNNRPSNNAFPRLPPRTPTPTTPKSLCRNDNISSLFWIQFCCRQNIWRNYFRAGEKCQSMSSCPSFQIERRAWKELPRGSREYSDALEKLKGKICNKQSQMVCCAGWAPFKLTFLPFESVVCLCHLLCHFLIFSNLAFHQGASVQQPQPLPQQLQPQQQQLGGVWEAQRVASPGVFASQWVSAQASSESGIGGSSWEKVQQSTRGLWTTWRGRFAALGQRRFAAKTISSEATLA